MTAAIILLIVLVIIAWKIRPRKFVTKERDGSTWVSRDKKGWKGDDQ